MYFVVSLHRPLYLKSSYCIFIYLFVSLCISMYLFVSFEIGSKDTKRYKKIHVSFGKSKDTKRYMYLFVSFEPVSKDIKIH